MAEIVPLRLLPPHGIDILDQTLLPLEERRIVLRDLEGVCEAIQQLRVRGAPLLGLAGACGMAIAAQTTDCSDDVLRRSAAKLVETRPTAADLGVYVFRALTLALAVPSGADATPSGPSRLTRSNSASRKTPASETTEQRRSPGRGRC